MWISDKTKDLIHSTYVELVDLTDKILAANFNEAVIDRLTQQQKAVIKKFRKEADNYELEFAQMDVDTGIDFEFIKDTEFGLTLTDI